MTAADTGVVIGRALVVGLIAYFGFKLGAKAFGKPKEKTRVVTK